jgi:hypothetical protein
MGSQVLGARSVTGAVNYMHQSIPFESTCQTCGLPQPQCDSRAALKRLLDANYPIEGYCRTCDEFWSISPKERAALAEAVARIVPIERSRTRTSRR